MAVDGRLLTVLGGFYAVGRRLQSIQRGLGALLLGGVATGSRSMTRVDQGGTVLGAEVTIAAAPRAVDSRMAPVQRRVLDRDDAGRLIPLLRRQVTSPCRDIPMICRHVTRDCACENLIDLGVALDAVTVPFVRRRIPEVGRTVAPVSGRIALIRDPVTFISHAVTLVSSTLPLAQLTLLRIVHSAYQHRQSPKRPSSAFSAGAALHCTGVRRPRQACHCGGVTASDPGNEAVTAVRLPVDERSVAVARGLVRGALDYAGLGSSAATETLGSATFHLRTLTSST